MNKLPSPNSDEYAEFYAGYVQRAASKGDVLTALSQQIDEINSALGNLSDEQALFRDAPNEWAIKEVMGHHGQRRELIRPKPMDFVERRAGADRAHVLLVHFQFQVAGSEFTTDAHDLLRRQGGGAALGNRGRHAARHRHIQVRGREFEPILSGLEQDVVQDRQRGPWIYHVLNG